MKVIQVPMGEELLKAMNRKAKVPRSSRAAVIRKACEEYIRKLEEEELDRQYIEGYRRKPEDPIWGKTGSQLAAEVWPQEDSEEWDEKGRGMVGQRRQTRRSKTGRSIEPQRRLRNS